MSKLRLGLLGKDIKHSLSPGIYNELISKPFSYDILDFANSDQLPSLDYLRNKFDGLNITSPYKNHFLPLLEEKSFEVSISGGLNCLSFFNGVIKVTNTDFFAVREEMKKFDSNKFMIAILGNGPMAKIAVYWARFYGFEFTHFCREAHGDLSHLVLEQKTKPWLIINACSRDFIFEGKTSQESIFWDFNYNLKHHKEELPKRFAYYLDGTSLLKSQALLCVQFWNLN